MNILAMDTTSRCTSIAVLRDDTVQLEYNFSSDDNVSSLLVPSLEFLLKTLKLGIDDIDVFAVAIGPGLFTGIRVGLSTLKGLLLGKNKPMVPVVTLLALASKLGESHKVVAPLIDARRGEVYAALYTFEKGAVEERIAPFLARVESLPGRFSSCLNPAFVGSGAEVHHETLKKQFPGSRIFYRSSFLASEIGRLALVAFRQNRYIEDLQQLLPLYIRRPDAEMNRSASQDGQDSGTPHSQG